MDINNHKNNDTHFNKWHLYINGNIIEEDKRDSEFRMNRELSDEHEETTTSTTIPEILQNIIKNCSSLKTCCEEKLLNRFVEPMLFETLSSNIKIMINLLNKTLNNEKTKPIIEEQLQNHYNPNENPIDKLINNYLSTSDTNINQFINDGESNKEVLYYDYQNTHISKNGEEMNEEFTRKENNNTMMENKKNEIDDLDNVCPPTRNPSNTTEKDENQVNILNNEVLDNKKTTKLTIKEQFPILHSPENPEKTQSTKLKNTIMDFEKKSLSYFINCYKGENIDQFIREIFLGKKSFTNDAYKAFFKNKTIEKRAFAKFIYDECDYKLTEFIKFIQNKARDINKDTFRLISNDYYKKLFEKVEGLMKDDDISKTDKEQNKTLLEDGKDETSKKELELEEIIKKRKK